MVNVQLVEPDGGAMPWERFPLNSEGVLYYVRADGGDLLGCPPFQSIAEAKAWAEAQLWAPIQWEG